VKSTAVPLAAQWFEGWVGAAVQQRPDLRIDDYVKRRAEDGFTAEIGHNDVLAIF